MSEKCAYCIFDIWILLYRSLDKNARVAPGDSHWIRYTQPYLCSVVEEFAEAEKLTHSIAHLPGVPNPSTFPLGVDPGLIKEGTKQGFSSL